MIFHKRPEVVFVSVIAGLALILSSCYKLSNDAPPKKSDAPSDVQPKQSFEPQPHEDLTKVPVETKIEDSLRRIKDPNKLEIAQKILKEKSKFRSMAKKCSPGDRTDEHMAKYGAYGEILLFPSPLESGVYLVGLKCTVSGLYSDEFRFFIYADKSGISLEQLKFTVVRANKNGKLSFEETPEIQARGRKYNPSKKELSFIIFFKPGEGRFGTLTKYKYENKRFVLSEFWQGDLSNFESGASKTLKQLYP